jgi:hypothetical protein
MSDIKHPIHLADRSRSGLMERCRRRALQMTEQAGPYEVWQHLGKDRGHRMVGYMPAIPSRSTSGIFEIRPLDFTWGEIDGERVILAAWSIGPGDFACVPGFVRADGTPPPRSDAAHLYDTLALLGDTRTQTMGAVIDELLSKGIKRDE